MERNYMKNDALVELDFITERHMAFHSHENFEFLFVISGKLVITIDENVYQLSPGDMLVVNINRKHSYNGSQEMVAARFLISHMKVRELLGQEQILFWCNSTIDHNDAYQEMQRLIVRILNQSMGEQRKNRLYMNSMYYQLLHTLSENFLLTEDHVQYEAENNKNDARIQEIFSYIRANYRQNIMLEDIAKHLYLSPIYVSKYIKQQCGINFMELLNTVRLNRAMEDLMYSDDSVMKIALDNGFASVSAYNKVFKKAYEMTPSEFRKQKRTYRNENAAQEQKTKDLIRKKVDEYLEKRLSNGIKEEKLWEQTAEIDVEVWGEKKWDGYCCRMINAGAAKDLMNAIFQ